MMSIHNTALREVVSEKVNQRWVDWARTHPHLAQVVDRTRLIESTVERLQDQPEFAEAMRQADLDENTLMAALKLLNQTDHLIRLVLPL